MGTRKEVDFSTLALAFVYFERACIAKSVDKHNRKLAASTAMLLAFKFNEPMLEEKKELDSLFQSLTNVFGVAQKDVVKHEFNMLVALNFDLIVPAAIGNPVLLQFLQLADQAALSAQYVWT